VSVFPPSGSDLSGFPRTCTGCQQPIRPTSKKGPPVAHWFETKNGKHLSWHFNCRLERAA
jgi:hypothetical protein